MGDRYGGHDELGKRWRQYLYDTLPGGRLSDSYSESPSFVSEAKQELLRLIVDVQQNRNRPEGME
jgi:hypothetical protein